MKDHSTEADARIVIDDLFRQAGWDPADKSQVLTEISVHDTTWVVAEPVSEYGSGPSRKTQDGDEIPTGRADYVLMDRRGRPIAIVEAKRSAIEPYTAKQQALPYAKKIGAPFIFLTNGELIYFWDYGNDDARIVNSFFSRRDLERLVEMRATRKPLATVEIPEYYLRQGETRQVRPYQGGAMQALDHAVELGKRRFLIELPTGTGKTDLICLLTHLGQSALNGQFRTPRQIRTMMVKMVDPDLGDTIYDPACGTGGFLIDAVEYILARYSTEPQEVPIYGEEWLEKRGQTIEEARRNIPTLQTYRKGPGEKIYDWSLLERSIYGIDVSRQMMRIAMMNLVLHGIRKANVKRANTLSDMGGLAEDDLNRRYKVILSNPPFAGVLPRESIRKDLPTTSKKSELLFLGVMMEALAPGGHCAVVVPEGLLFGSTSAHVELRRKLVEEYDLLAVISLPAGVFKSYAGVKTGVLVFRHPTTGAQKDRKARHKEKVWFYEIRADGFDPDKIQAGGRPETPERNDIPDLLRQRKEYKGSRFADAPGVEAGTLLPPGSEEPRCWWATIKTVAENDYNLAAGRYKPQIAEKAPDEDPAELIRETLAIEREIVIGLERLLREVEP